MISTKISLQLWVTYSPVLKYMFEYENENETETEIVNAESINLLSQGYLIIAIVNMWSKREQYTALLQQIQPCRYGLHCQEEI
ncbi:hypothetical protein L2E82_50522 [Cichorium intybus]|nr:hypothetical protein L2E82_50522 [Cichorium intybus]